MRIRRQLVRGARAYIVWARDYKAVREILDDTTIKTTSWLDAVEIFSKQRGRRVSSIRAYKKTNEVFGGKMDTWPASKWISHGRSDLST